MIIEFKIELTSVTSDQIIRQEDEICVLTIH